MSKADNLYNIRRFQEALSAYLAELQADPQDARTLAMISNCHSQLNALGEAMRFAQQAVSVDPDYAYGHRTLGYAFANLGNWKQARISLENARDLDPGNADNYSAIAWLEMHHGRASTALPYLETALQLEPSDPQTFQLLARCYSTLNKKELALEMAQNALRLAPDDDESHIAYGIALLANGRRDEAEQAITEALRLNPQSDHAEAALRESIRAQFPLYRRLHQQLEWVENKGNFFRWAVTGGLYLVSSSCSRVLRANKETELAGQLIMVAFGFYFAYLFLLPVMSNVMLLAHRLGRFALKSPQRKSTLLILGFLAFTIISSLLALMIRGRSDAAESFAVGGVLTLAMSMIYTIRQQHDDCWITTLCLAIPGIFCVLGFGFY